MTYVNAAGTTQVGQTAQTQSSHSSTPTGLNQLDNPQTFLELLVAQLKNQNPDNPANPTSFMTEIAQLTAVQSQTSLNAEEQTVAADSMLGQNITGTGANGKTVSGQVTSVTLSPSGAPQLGLSGQNTSVALDAVTQVYSALGGGTASSNSNPNSNG